MFYFKRVHSRSLQTFATFWPKISEHDVTKTPFSKKKKISTILFSENLVVDVILMLKKVLIVLFDICCRFELSRKSGRGRNLTPPPQRGAFVYLDLPPQLLLEQKMRGVEGWLVILYSLMCSQISVYHVLKKQSFYIHMVFNEVLNAYFYICFQVPELSSTDHGENWEGH